MKLCFKQRFFSWFDSYDIYDASTGATAFTVEGKLAWGHCLHILDAQGRHIATVKERVLTFLPKFDLYIGERSIGTIRKEFTLFRPAFVLDFNGWRVQGSFLEWDYTIEDAAGRTVARIAKELLRWTDITPSTYRTRETRCAHSWWSSPLTPKNARAAAIEAILTSYARGETLRGRILSYAAVIPPEPFSP